MNPNSPVAERLLRVIHYVYLRGIKPKNGVYKNDGISVHLSLAEPTCREFEYGITYLDRLVSKLGREGSCLNSGRLMTSSIEEMVKKVEETLSCGKAVSEANGFVREDIEWRILGLWKSLFDKAANEATQTMKVIKYRILLDLFLPLHNELAPP
ncbi:unnamed protein product [Arabis nemorensis]|uniref:Uncharacterized protein n=1 Tax=Arabis nemorensis TaxID=586526 RepID=A0A565CW59_9BRAS|nr:unnamed protein product [Arabis nemorensis]